MQLDQAILVRRIGEREGAALAVVVATLESVAPPEAAQVVTRLRGAGLTVRDLSGRDADEALDLVRAAAVAFLGAIGFLLAVLLDRSRLTDLRTALAGAPMMSPLGVRRRRPVWAPRMTILPRAATS